MPPKRCARCSVGRARTRPPANRRQPFRRQPGVRPGAGKGGLSITSGERRGVSAWRAGMRCALQQASRSRSNPCGSDPDEDCDAGKRPHGGVDRQDRASQSGRQRRVDVLDPQVIDGKAERDRQRAGGRDRRRAAPRSAAVDLLPPVHPRGVFLPDIAALGEADAVEFGGIAFEPQGCVAAQFGAAFGNAQRQAVRAPCLVGAEVVGLIDRREPAFAQRGEARIGRRAVALCGRQWTARRRRA
jgi:hypothetical protein